MDVVNSLSEIWKLYISQPKMNNLTKYKTLSQASRAARALGIKTSAEYRLSFTNDTRLPYAPEKVFFWEWCGWPAFLGTKRKRRLNIPEAYYATYAQSRRAAAGLGIRTKSEYLQRYSEDNKLPADPKKIYGSYWKDWDTYLLQVKCPKRLNGIYKTLTQASQAARALGPESAREYIKIYQTDPGLPSNPSNYYKDWKSWHHFLGTVHPEEKFYKTLRQASAAAKAMNICSARDYIKCYRLDSKLPSTPYQFYEKWVSWDSFLGNPIRR